MINVEEMPLDRGAYNLLTLLMSFILCLWIIRALLAIRSVAFLRIAAMQGRTVTLRGLGAYVHIFDSPTPAHMQSILHTRQSRPPKRVPALLLPVLPCQDAQAKVVLERESVLVPVHVSVACAVTPVWLLDWDQVASQFRDDMRSRNGQFGGSPLSRGEGGFGRSSGSGGSGSNQYYLTSGRKTIRLERSANAAIGKSTMLQAGKNELSVPLPPSPDLRILVLFCEPTAKDAMFPLTTIHTERAALSTSSNGSFSRVSLLGGRIFKQDTSSDAQPASPISSHAGSAVVELASAGDGACDALMLVFERQVSAMTAKDRFVAVDGVLFALQEVYGLKGRATSPQDVEAQSGSERRSEQRDSEERADEEDVCIVCFTEPMQVVLLPCRHLSVCTGCFSHIDKCPVCRAPFEQYLTLETDRKTLMQTHGFQSSTPTSGSHSHFHSRPNGTDRSR